MTEQDTFSFEKYAIVACGTIRPELEHLKKTGFLNAAGIEYTKPGRHEDFKELESQLVEKIRKAKSYAEYVIVVYGGKYCYIDLSNPERTIDDLLAEQGDNISRVDATHCIDMLASQEDRIAASNGERVYWLTPGWILHKNLVFQDWDKARVNEMFPQHTGGAILLDAIGFWDDISANDPEKLLEFMDWMGIPIQPYPVSSSRLEKLIIDAALKLRPLEVGEKV